MTGLKCFHCSLYISIRVQSENGKTVRLSIAISLSEVKWPCVFCFLPFLLTICKQEFGELRRRHLNVEEVGHLVSWKGSQVNPKTLKLLQGLDGFMYLYWNADLCCFNSLLEMRMQTLLPQGAGSISHSLVASKVSLRLTRLKLVKASARPQEGICSSQRMKNGFWQECRKSWTCLVSLDL